MIWLGSKKAISKELWELIVSKRQEGQVEFYEPFCGSVSLVPHMKKEDGFKQVYLSDLNESLILFLRALQSGKFLVPQKHYTREDYDRFKKQEHASVEKFYVGNYYSYMGTYFHAYLKPKQKGAPGSNDIARMKKMFAKCPVPVHISHNSYFRYGAKRNCVFYLDPPYSKQSQRYGFSVFDTDEFWEFARKLSKHNTVLISELTAPPDFEVVWEKDVRIFNGDTRKEKVFMLKST